MADYIELLAAHDRLVAERDRLKAEVAELVRALKWALPSARLEVERLGNALAGPSITQGMREDHYEAELRLDEADAALARARGEPKEPQS